MPIRSGKDKQGTFYRWGTTGKKFYFDPESEISKGRALSRAKKQEAAIYAAGYKGDSKMPNFNRAVAVGEKLQGNELKAKIQQSIADEYEAASRYLQIAEASEDEAVKKLFIDIANEEIVHVGEFRAIYKKLFPDDVKLETDGETEAQKIIGGEQTEEDEEEASAEGDKTVKKDEAEKTKKKILKIISK